MDPARTSHRQPRRLPVSIGVWIGVALVPVLALVVRPDPIETTDPGDPAEPVAYAVPNVDLATNTARFVSECGHSHSANNDPILFPGQPGESHFHDFFGNTGTDADSTHATLAEGTTTCQGAADLTAYWAPALFQHGEHVEPLGVHAYYRVAPGTDPESVRAFPEGLMMIAGDATASSPQPTEVVAWSCDRSPVVSAAPQQCPKGAPLSLRVTFPDCWRGGGEANLDSADHRSHVAYGGGEGCPPSHPVAIPQLTLAVRYPIYGPIEGLSLAPGSLLQGHADFFNAWDPAKLENEIGSCLQRGVVCVIPGSTGHHAAFAEDLKDQL
ncbi:MAG: hypothetical protein JJLCMIEE_01614 [Acidimicrobiales bacterium]|nr:MAG: DUF1996 domain-containing protein [Actinomycetota bacterium]MBV6508550.1 hypothetical protein [Acidimicrobiales bacterium]RIK05137.1 MAG: hypothetical protein DCC48_10985 [Acidobacteriota bacterium]